MTFRKLAEGLVCLSLFVTCMFWNEVSNSIHVLALSANYTVVVRPSADSNATVNVSAVVNASVPVNSTAVIVISAATPPGVWPLLESTHTIRAVDYQRRQDEVTFVQLITLERSRRETAISKMRSQLNYAREHSVKQLRLQQQRSVGKDKTAALLWQAGANLLQVAMRTWTEIETHVAYVAVMGLNICHDVFNMIYKPTPGARIGERMTGSVFAPAKMMMTVFSIGRVATGQVYTAISKKAAARVNDELFTSMCVCVLVGYLLYHVYMFLRDMYKNRIYAQDVAEYYDNCTNIQYLYWKTAVNDMSNFDFNEGQLDESIVRFAAFASLPSHDMTEQMCMNGLASLMRKLESVAQFHVKYPWRKANGLWFNARMGLRTAKLQPRIERMQNVMTTIDQMLSQINTMTTTQERALAEAAVQPRA